MKILNKPIKSSFSAVQKFGMIERRPGYFSKGNSTFGNDREHEGIWVYAIEWLSQRCNFTYRLVPMGDDVGKSSLFNGSGLWSGATGRLLQGELDVIAPPILLSRARSIVFDYVGLVDQETSALITPALTEQSPFLSTIRPFTLTVWAGIILSLLSVAIFLTIFTPNGVGIRSESLICVGKYVYSTLAILASQGTVFSGVDYHSRLPFRLTSGFWCVFTVVIVNLYSSTLISHITTRKMNTPPKTTMDAIDNGLSYLALDEGFSREFILSITSGPLKKMSDAFRQHPENFVPNREVGFLKVASGCCAFSELTNYLELRLEKDIEETGKCRVHMGEYQSAGLFVGLIVRKKNPYQNMINKGILDLYQSGLIIHWRKKLEFKKASICKSNQPRKRIKELRRLNLRDLSSAYIILGLGFALSLVVFLAEQFRRF